MSSNTGNNSLDSLVYGSWYGQLGTPVQLTYSFLTRAPVHASAEDRNGFVAMSATQQAAVRDALAKWASVTNLTFTETVRNTGNLQFGTNDQGDSSSAYAYLPEAGVSTLAMYTNNQDAYNSVFTPGTYGPAVLLHEIGHLLGLKHPGNYDSTGSTIDGPFLPEATDNGDYTQMSYNEPSSWAINRHYATTPMLYDIQAIQYLYGANMSWHAGTDVYTFTNGVAPQCIWDAGGDNTFDFSGCTGATIINLNAGSFSETAPGLNNVSIAYGVTVRTAIAGAGGATIYANDLGNVLRGGQGTDVFHEGGGNDTVDGGDGADTVVFEGTYAQHAVLRAAGGGITVLGDGTDTLTNVEMLQFSDRSVRVADLALPVMGSEGNDKLVAPAGNVTIDAGAGLDTVAFAGRAAEFSIKIDNGSATVTGRGIADVLVNVERISFSDATVALDVGSGHAGQLFRLYEAAFQRVPDKEGLGFWLGALDNGHAPLDSIARSFITSPEFLQRYGETDNATFLTLVYQNVLGRAPDAEGFAWHLNNLEQGLPRERALLDFSESIEFTASLVGTVANGVQYVPFA